MVTMPFFLRRRPRFLQGPYIDHAVRATEIRTLRLRLRPHKLEDAEAWYRLQSNPEVVRFLSWPLRDRRSSRKHLRDRTRHSILWQSGDFLALAVEFDGHLIGDVSLHLRSVISASRAVEIGWIIDPAFGRRGYGTEAADAMLDVAFSELDARIVLAAVDLRNEASIALAHKLSFVPAGRSESTETLVVTADAHAERKSRGQRKLDSAGQL